jgi:hypothetical protein
MESGVCAKAARDWIANKATKSTFFIFGSFTNNLAKVAIWSTASNRNFLDGTQKSLNRLPLHNNEKSCSRVGVLFGEFRKLLPKQ